MPKKIVLKLILCGDPAVGKTSLIKRFVDHTNYGFDKKIMGERNLIRMGIEAFQFLFITHPHYLWFMAQDIGLPCLAIPAIEIAPWEEEVFCANMYISTHHHRIKVNWFPDSNSNCDIGWGALQPSNTNIFKD